jgi:hypothetical protein
MEWDSFIEIFNPGHKHLREERDRKRIEAQIPATAGPPLGIDLDGGVAHLVMPPTTPDATPDTTADEPSPSPEDARG